MDKFLKVRAATGSVPTDPTEVNPYFTTGIGTGSDARPAHEIVRGMIAEPYGQRSRMEVFRDGKFYRLAPDEVPAEGEQVQYAEPIEPSSRGHRDGVIV